MGHIWATLDWTEPTWLEMALNDGAALTLERVCVALLLQVKEGPMSKEGDGGKLRRGQSLNTCFECNVDHAARA
jgi:hypothetical protein